jgi:IS605 OrfB family transposase
MAKLQTNIENQFTKANTFAVKNLKPYQSLLIDRILKSFQEVYLCAIDELEEIVEKTGKLPGELTFLKNCSLHRNNVEGIKHIQDLNLIYLDSAREPYKKLIININRILDYHRAKFFKLVVDDVKASLAQNCSKEEYNFLLNKKILLSIIKSHKESSGQEEFFKNIVFLDNQYVLGYNPDGKINSVFIKFNNNPKIDSTLKLGKINVFCNREVLPGIPKRLIISRSKAGKYSITITFNLPDTELKYRFNEASGQIGIDFNLKKKDVMVTSCGDKIRKYDKQTSKELSRLLAYKKKLNTQLSNKQHFLATVTNDKKAIPDSNNYKRTLQKLRVVEEKIANIRKHHNHRITNDLLSKYKILCVEDIQTAELLEKKDGKINKYIKTAMNRNMSDLSFGEIKSMFEYKCKWYGNKFILVPARGTTQTCNNCGNIPEERIGLDVTVYECQKCGHKMDRDINAAKNILDNGLKILNS